ncbi:MAG: vWA domain-containing protein [Trebonia sp.]
MTDGPNGKALSATRRADVAGLASVFGAALRTAGIPAGPDRSVRLAEALTVMRASTLAEFHACALATMISDPGQIDTFERVFASVFSIDVPGRRAPTVMAPQQGMAADPLADPAPPPDSSAPDDDRPPVIREVPADVPGPAAPRDQADDPERTEVPAIRRVASATERLRTRDFSQLTASELRDLAALMRQLALAVPPRRTRRYRPRKDGARLDMRRTLRQARRTGGEPVRIARRAVRVRPRRLVVLCDISGSMEPYARALLQLMYVASRGGPAVGRVSGSLRDPSRPRTEVFTFATRLTRLTPALSAATPETMLARAGEAAPDWSGGTRIGAALKEFNDRYGVRGMGRGAVILIISDGWETGDPALLGEQMARLHRVAYRIVWANPRTQSPRYRPEVGGMAAAWPYCDTVVSAHNFAALDDLLDALRSPSVKRPSFAVPDPAAAN